ncbi:hypothetical protein [Nocardia acidivorans]|uniref:hypothetical protein n=1 Tax=Nocardia acidivorans TaxID=404580 RepID=UPI001FE07303|nr:hypothetical protein [Nocardia acidivorans]
MRKFATVALVVVAVSALAGCDHGGAAPGTSGAAAPSSARPDASSVDRLTTAPLAPQAPSGLPARDGATVDARDYQQGDRFYFQSPSGNIMCGFNVGDGSVVGCQLARVSVVPPALPDCGSRPDRAVAARIAGGAAQFACLNQGVFVGDPVGGGSKGGGKVLPYGATITVQGTACESLRTGVRCSSGGHGFMVAAGAQSLF